MKGYIIVDIPVDDPAEIDEYTMMADVEVYPCTLSTKEKLRFVLHHVDIRPFPCKRETKAHWINENGKEIITTEPSDYDRGRNDLIDEMKEGTE